MILDTNALSALAEGDAALLQVLEGQPELAVPVIALGEYLYGIRQSRFQLRYERWLNASLSVLDLLAVGRDTALPYAEIRRELKAAGQRIPTNDLWIAALGREHNLPIVSRDRHFEAVRGLRLVTW